MKILQQGLGSLRGAIGTPDQIRDLCRRYRKAGVDQIIFVSQAGPNRHEHICESLELFAKEVLPEFAAGRRRGRPRQSTSGWRARWKRRWRGATDRGSPTPTTRSRRRTPGRRPAAPSGAARRPPPERRRAGGARGPAPCAALRGAGRQERGEEAFTRFVHGARTTGGSSARLGSDPGLRILFTSMARRFRPDKAAGFEGEIEYRLRANGSVRPWVDRRSAARRATARPGSAGDPKLTITADTAAFLRIAARDLDPGKALLSGQLDARRGLRGRRQARRDVRRAFVLLSGDT